MDSVKSITIDLETTGLDYKKDKILIIGFKLNNEDFVRTVVPLKETAELNLLEGLLRRKDIIIRGHNIKFDIKFLKKQGFDVNGILDDTRILAYLESPFQDIDLESLVESKLKKKHLSFKDFQIKHREVQDDSQVKIGSWCYPKDKLREKNKEDIIFCEELRKELIANDWYKKVEQPLISILMNMELKGIKLDIPYLKELRKEHEEKIKEARETFKFNPASPKQVKAAFEALRVNVESTDKHNLKHLSWNGNELAAKLLKFRELNKLYTSYSKPLTEEVDEEDRIHGAFNQAGTEENSRGVATGRLSSSGPNLQQVPSRTEEGKRIRRAFIPSPGFLMVVSDLKQIEPRLVAHYSQSPKLLAAFNQGLDTHAIMGAGIFQKDPDKLTKMERFIGKTSWLATCYGAWYKKLKWIVEINSDEDPKLNEEDYKEIQDNFWRSNPDIYRWRRWHIEETKKLGYIKTIGGRIIRINGLNSKNDWERKEAERTAVNYQIQGSAADIMKLIIVNFQNWINYEGLNDHIKLLASIHDELMIEMAMCEGAQKEGYWYQSFNNFMQNPVKLKNLNIEADTKIIEHWGMK